MGAWPVAVEIYSLGNLIDRSYVIRDEGAVLVDTGMPWTAGQLVRALSRLPAAARSIRLIVLTHGHFDHAGGVREVKRLTGAPVAAHRLDADIVEGRRLTTPNPQTRWAKALWSPLALLMPHVARRYCTGVDVLIGDEGLSLVEYGIAGRIVHTPGHTAGSLSVLLDNGDAVVGCMAHAGPPFRLGPDFPQFADDPEQLRLSWHKLIAMGAKRIYPGHGRPFPVDVIATLLEQSSWGRGRQ